MAFSLLTKYLIRHRGAPLFNPSNIGLVAAFLVLGSTVVEPLDFWWSPLDGPMIVAYAVILIGGVLITRASTSWAWWRTYWWGLARGHRAARRGPGTAWSPDGPSRRCVGSTSGW